MKISIIGAGAIGGNLARRLSEAGHDVLIANTRGPQSIEAEVTATGARPVSAESATQDRDVVILAVPFGVQPQLKKLLAAAQESTVVVDTSNYYPGMNGHIEAVVDGQVESLWSQEHLGRPVVKAWNAALAETQRNMGQPTGASDRIALPVAGDSDRARATVMQLVDESGFDAYDAGVLAESWRQQPGTPAYCTELGLEELEHALLAAEKDKAPATRDRLMEHFGALRTMPSHEQTVAINRAAHY
ncbi:NADPH-dependent F420 reductase [Glutamicibacter arilaitensis]|uniref:NADPH-dependent F420 reductase n=1 Tax=Glutamicibacter arilaitensis TaxID=256701 RepID=UPI00384FE36D